MDTMDSIKVDTLYNMLIENLNIALTSVTHDTSKLECHTEHLSTLRQKSNIITNLENLFQLIITLKFYNKYDLFKSDESFYTPRDIIINGNYYLGIIIHALGTLLYYDKIITICTQTTLHKLENRYPVGVLYR